MKTSHGACIIMAMILENNYCVAKTHAKEQLIKKLSRKDSYVKQLKK